MFLLWRSLVSFLSLFIAGILLTILLKYQVLDILSLESLPDFKPPPLPPADTIIPNLIKSAQAVQSSSSPTPTSTAPSQTPTGATQSKSAQKPAKDLVNVNYVVFNSSVPGTSGANSGTVLSPQECVAFAKYCRDYTCAFQDFYTGCNNGGMCTCIKTSAASTLSPIRRARSTFSSPISLLLDLFGSLTNTIPVIVAIIMFVGL